MPANFFEESGEMLRTFEAKFSDFIDRFVPTKDLTFSLFDYFIQRDAVSIK